MEIINISKKNEVYIQIDCEASTAQEICDHFTFMVPGYTFMPAYRNRMWDGKIRLFDSRKKTLYTGLYKYLCEFCEVRDYNLEVKNNRVYGTLESLSDTTYESLLSNILPINSSILWN